MVESQHRGHVVIVDQDGGVCAALGDPHLLVYPRSAVKPVQAAAMLSLGLDIDGSALALASASHSGEPFHLAGVRELLSRAGLPEDALQCPADLPYEQDVRAAYLAAGGRPERIVMNCSGKHAAMLWTSSVNGWPLQTYLDPGHPLQQYLRAQIGSYAGTQPGPTSADGCGTPLWGLPLVALARAILRLSDSPEGARVARAMRSYPEYSGGTTRDVTHLMRGVPGLLAKDGAESVQAMTVDTPQGRFAVALKIEDGTQRARPVVAAAALAALGIAAPVVTEHLRWQVLGGGRSVGSMAPSPELAAFARM